METAALVETLRQEVRRLADRVMVTEDAVGSIEDGLAGAAGLVERIALDQDAFESAEVASEDAKDSGPSVEEMTPDLDVLIPWVEANVSGWCERRAATKTEASRGIKWCRRWYEHPEAVTRLWVVRAAQLEAAEAGPVAVAMYLRDCFDYHVSVLTGPDGPFHNCNLHDHLTSVKEEDRYLPTAELSL